MRLAFKFGSKSKNTKFTDPSQALEFIELPNFEIPKEEVNDSATENISFPFSKHLRSTSLDCSQTQVGGVEASQVTSATTTEVSKKQEKPSVITETSTGSLVHYIDSQGLLQTVEKPAKVSTSQKIKATVANYTDSARKIIFKTKSKSTTEDKVSEDLPILESPNSAETRVEVQTETGSGSSVCAQILEPKPQPSTRKSSGSSKKNHLEKKKKNRTTRKFRLLAAKKRHAKRRTTRSGKVLSRVPKHLEAWEDIKQNVKRPEDQGYDLKFDYNKLLKPSFVENWLNDTVQPLVTTLQMSGEQLGEGQIKYAVDFETRPEEPKRSCAKCKKDPTGASGLGNCDTCYYFLKAERTEFLKYGDAKKIKRVFDAHAACPYMSSDVEDSFASTGDSLLGICLWPIMGVWEKLDHKIFWAKVRFRQFKESVPVWSRKVRTAANHGYGLRSLKPDKYGKKSLKWGDLLLQDFSPIYDKFWTEDFGPAWFYKIDGGFSSRPANARFVGIPYPDSEPESSHISWYNLNGGFRKAWSGMRKKKVKQEEAKLSRAAKKTATKRNNRKVSVKFADEDKKNSSPTELPNSRKFELKSEKFQKQTREIVVLPDSKVGDSNSERASADTERLHDSASTLAAHVIPLEDEKAHAMSFSTVALLAQSVEESTVSKSTSFETSATESELKVPLPATNLEVVEEEPVELHENTSQIKTLEDFATELSADVRSPVSSRDSSISVLNSRPFAVEFISASPTESNESEIRGLKLPTTPAVTNEPLKDPNAVQEVFVDVIQKIDEMLSNLGYKPQENLASSPKVSERTSLSSLNIGHQSCRSSNFEELSFENEGFNPIVFDSEDESPIEEIYTTHSGEHSRSGYMKDLTEELINEILSQYNQGKFDQEGNPNAAAETLGALLDEVFKGIREVKGDGDRFENIDKKSSSPPFECEDSNRFTLLEDSDEDIENASECMELSSDIEAESTYAKSLIFFEHPCSKLKELKLVRKDNFLEKREKDMRDISYEKKEESLENKVSVIENTQEPLKQLKLVSKISLPVPMTIKPLRVLGIVVEPTVRKVIPRTKNFLHPVITVSKNVTGPPSNKEKKRCMISNIDEVIYVCHTDIILTQRNYLSTIEEVPAKAEEPSKDTCDVTAKKVSAIHNEEIVKDNGCASLITESCGFDIQSVDGVVNFEENPQDVVTEPEIPQKFKEYFEFISTNPDVLFEIRSDGEEPETNQSEQSCTPLNKIILDTELDSDSEFGGSMDEEMNRAAFFDYLADPLDFKDETLWFALSLDSDFDRMSVNKNNRENDELDIVRNAKESLPKMANLLEMAIKATNYEESEVDFGLKRKTKVSFKESEDLCQVEVFDRNLAPSAIKSCVSNLETLTKESFRKPENHEIGRFIKVKEFNHPFNEEERAENERDICTKLEECREVISGFKGKQDIDELQDVFIKFLECFKLSRESFAEVATSSIFSYSNWLSQIRKTISAALALTSGAGNRFVLLLSFIDQAGKSEWSINRAEKDMSKIYDLISTVVIMLEQVQEAILQLRLEFPDYVGTMAEIAEVAVSSRKEILETYSMFCLTSVKDSIDVASVHYCTGYEVFMEKTKFLAEAEHSDYEVKFATALNDLQRSHGIVSAARTDLEKYLQLISMKLANLKDEYETERLLAKRSSQETQVSIKTSTGNTDFDGQTLKGSIEDVSTPAANTNSGPDNKKSQDPIDQGEPKESKSKFKVPGWMKLKGIGKKR